MVEFESYVDLGGMIHLDHRQSNQLVIGESHQVLLPDQEMKDIQRLAKQESLTVGERVRRTLREARARKPASSAEAKLRAIRRAAELSFPTADIAQMINEIEQGYQP